MLHTAIEILSNYPRLFLFCRSLLEANFTAIRNTIQENLPTDDHHRILDVACGPGAFSTLFNPDGYVGVDINSRYINHARQYFKGQFFIQDARMMKFEDGHFDKALVFGLLHHLSDEDVQSVLENLWRVLTPGGSVLVIEDIPTESNLNIIGHMLHWAENGHYIRPPAEYRRLLCPLFETNREEVFRSGVCDYYMAKLSRLDARGDTANTTDR